jgi:hypothetical protein
MALVSSQLVFSPLWSFFGACRFGIYLVCTPRRDCKSFCNLFCCAPTPGGTNQGGGWQDTKQQLIRSVGTSFILLRFLVIKRQSAKLQIYREVLVEAEQCRFVPRSDSCQWDMTRLMIFQDWHPPRFNFTRRSAHSDLIQIFSFVLLCPALLVFRKSAGKQIHDISRTSSKQEPEVHLSSWPRLRLLLSAFFALHDGASQ